MSCANRVVHLPALDLFAGVEGLLHRLDADIARVAHDLEDLTLFVAGRTDRAGPGDVVVDGVGPAVLAQMSSRTKSPSRMGAEPAEVGS